MANDWRRGGRDPYGDPYGDSHGEYDDADDRDPAPWRGAAPSGGRGAGRSLPGGRPPRSGGAYEPTGRGDAPRFPDDDEPERYDSPRSPRERSGPAGQPRSPLDDPRAPRGMRGGSGALGPSRASSSSSRRPPEPPRRGWDNEAYADPYDDGAGDRSARYRGADGRGAGASTYGGAGGQRRDAHGGAGYGGAGYDDARGATSRSAGYGAAARPSRGGRDGGFGERSGAFGAYGAFGDEQGGAEQGDAGYAPQDEYGRYDQGAPGYGPGAHRGDAWGYGRSADQRVDGEPAYDDGAPSDQMAPPAFGAPVTAAPKRAGRRRSALIGIAAAALVVAVVGSLLGALLLTSKHSSPNGSRASGQSFATYTPGATPTPLPDTTQFSSARMNYTLDYPSQWAVMNTDASGSGSFDYLDTFAQRGSATTFIVEQAGAFAAVGDDAVIGSEVAGAKQSGLTFTETTKAVQKTQVGGQTWLRREYDVTKDKTALHMAILACHHGVGRGYVIVLVSSAGDFGGANDNAFSKMLTSFRFAN